MPVRKLNIFDPTILRFTLDFFIVNGIWAEKAVDHSNFSMIAAASRQLRPEIRKKTTKAEPSDQPPSEASKPERNEHNPTKARIHRAKRLKITSSPPPIPHSSDASTSLFSGSHMLHCKPLCVRRKRADAAQRQQHQYGRQSLDLQ